MLPWLLIRQDHRGNRYRVGSYATRVEAQRFADRLGVGRESPEGSDTDSYLVESRDHGSGARG
ncbi:hypothetical protein N566_04070 [Streptomycetaceae bacterium MP113-05]|nr:hypothetical protein N566_04070 [Streptomycetaceae bacterium MP113-05]